MADLNENTSRIYELVETIKALPKSAEGNYELLDTITLTEETSKVVFDKYTDGTSLNLKKAYVVLEIPKVEKTFSVSVHINYEYYNYIWFTAGNTSYNTIYDVEAAINNGLLRTGFAYHTNHVSNPGTWNTVVGKLTKNINALILTGTFLVGTKFNIYGVKNTEG